MRPLLGWLGLTFVPVAALAYTFARAQALPANAPRRFVRDASKKTVGILGASIVHGRVSENVVDLVAARLGGEYQVVNAGVNGDLAYNAKLRVGELIACKPDVAIVLVGSNDVMAAQNDASEARYRRMKKLPQKPTLAWYRDNMRAIVSALQDAGAKVAVCSLPVLGEALDDDANRRVAEYSAAVAEIAREMGATYLPIHEDIAAVLRAERPSGGRPFDDKTVWLMLRAIVERHLLGRSFDAIGARNGFLLLSDGVHLSSRAAAMVADRFEKFVRESVAAAHRAASAYT
jgi:lysophospholipase L1-like esterase